VDICYHLVDEGVVGVLFFDAPLAQAYEGIEVRAQEGVLGHRMYGSHPVSLWPQTPTDIRPVTDDDCLCLLKRTQ
jgi:hypothetical protein